MVSTTTSTTGAIPQDYRFLGGTLDYNRPIGARYALRISAAGQYAATPIPAAVQFSIGGDPYGLAFDGGSSRGDSGAAAVVELSREIETGTAAFGTISITALTDYGVVWNNDETRGLRAQHARIGGARRERDVSATG